MGETNRCADRSVDGVVDPCVRTASGGFAEFATVYERMVHELPDDHSLWTAALFETMAFAYHAIKVSGIWNYRALPVLIIGGSSSMGAAMALAVRVHLGSTIIVSDISPLRQQRAQDFADLVIDPATEAGIANVCLAFTNGSPVGVVFDCSGSQAAFAEGSRALRPKGTYVVLATFGGSVRSTLQ